MIKKYLQQAGNEKGAWPWVALAEAFVFFCATFGFSDFVLNTLIFKKTGWVDDERIPGTLVNAYIIPGIILAITYITGAVELSITTLIICVIVETAGSILGSKIAIGLDTAKIKKIIGFAMIFSMVALIAKLIISQGASGTASGLHGWQYAVALPIIFVCGMLNMVGVAMKPPLMSMFLLMGLSPLATLTILMAMAVFGPVSGSISFFKSGRYQKKIFVCAAVFGSIAALIASSFALSVNTIYLTIAMLIAMAIVSYTMLKK